MYPILSYILFYFVCFVLFPSIPFSSLLFSSLLVSSPLLSSPLVSFRFACLVSSPLSSLCSPTLYSLLSILLLLYSTCPGFILFCSGLVDFTLICLFYSTLCSVSAISFISRNRESPYNSGSRVCGNAFRKRYERRRFFTFFFHR